MSIIFGFLNKKEDTLGNNKYLAEMRNDLSFNSRLDVDSFKGRNIMFYHAHSRHERQKMLVENEDRSLALLMGGGVFDYKRKINDLAVRNHVFKYSNSPAEVALHLFEEYGATPLKDLNGNFALAIWDKRKNSLTIANNRFGLYPLFTYESDRVFIFCSQYQPIIKYNNFKKDLNHAAIAEYFILGATLENKTFFKELRILPSASVLELKKGKSKLTRYPVLDMRIDRRRPMKYFAEQINDRARHAVQLRVKEYETRKCQLSGGMDTRFILGCLSPSDLTRMRFLTILGTYLKEDEDRDVICARNLSRKLNLIQKIEKRPGETNFNARFFEKIRAAYLFDPYMLSGLCGGELLGGNYLQMYNRFIANYDKRGYVKKRSDFFSNSFLKKAAGPTNYLTNIQAEKGGAGLRNQPLLLSLHLLNRSFFSAVYDGGAFSEWVQPFHNFLGSRIYPFMDTDLLKFLFGVPREYLEESHLYIALLKNHHKDLFALPFASGTCKDSRLKQLRQGHAPKNYLYYRNKRTKYYKVLRQYLKRPTAWGEENYNKNFYRKIKAIAKIEKFLELNITFNTNIIRFINFEAWMRKYYIGSE